MIEKVFKLMKEYKIFLLEGRLGAGKTTMVKKIAKKLKIKEDISSPTFVIWQKYNFIFNQKKYYLNHIDLYRIKVEDILKIGLEQELKRKNNYFFIEWGEKIKDFLISKNKRFVEIIFTKNKNRRKYSLKLN